MNLRALRDKKDQQMNVRFTADEIRSLDEIAEAEDRDRAYLVGFFTRWGMAQYRRVGSLMSLRKKNVPVDTQRIGQIDRDAAARLELRQEAKDVEEEHGASGTSTTRKAR